MSDAENKPVTIEDESVTGISESPEQFVFCKVNPKLVQHDDLAMSIKLCFGVKKETSDQLVNVYT